MTGRPVISCLRHGRPWLKFMLVAVRAVDGHPVENREAFSSVFWWM
jgi:hypothetical protein